MSRVRLQRGELYRVRAPGGDDPRRSRVFLVVSRQVLLDSRYSTAICAPIFSAYDGLATQVPIGIEDGLKQECAIHCDQLMSLSKAGLTDFVATLSDAKQRLVDEALRVAVVIPSSESMAFQ